MFVLGIDPGLSRCGYGLVSRAEGTAALRAHAAGVVETDPGAPLEERLLILHTELRALVRELGPAAIVVERVFFQVNAKTAMSVGQASGLALLAATDPALAPCAPTPRPGEPPAAAADVVAAEASALTAAPAPLFVADLAAATGIRDAVVYQVLARLAESGAVEKRDAGGGRVAYIAIVTAANGASSSEAPSS